MFPEGRHVQTGLPAVQGSFFLLFVVFLTFSLPVLTSTLCSSSLYLILVAKEEQLMLFHISLCKCLVVSALLIVVSD